jgi:hypothetical protein
MASSTRATEPTGDGGGIGGAKLRPEADRPLGAPRWVRVFGAFAVVVVVLFVVLHLAGGGFRGHGP